MSNGKRGNTEENFEIELVESMNEHHAAVLVGGKFRIITESKNPSGETDVSYSSCADIANFYANRDIIRITVTDGKKEEKIINPFSFWLRHSKRRQYRGVVFLPGTHTVYHYNLWKGCQVEPEKGNIKPYADHVLNIICNHNRDLCKWVLDWLSHIFQHLAGPLPGTALVLRGKKGTGKGFFVLLLELILGAHFVPVSSEEEWLGTFSDHIAEAIIIHANEAFWAGSKKAEGHLKQIITENTRTINKKFLPAIKTKNYSRTIISSNEKWVVPATLDERRFCMLDVSDERQKDQGYFDQLFKWCDDKKNLSALLYYFQNRKITSNLRSPPVTAGLIEQAELSMTSVKKYWVECLERGFIPGGESKNPDGFDGWVKSKTVYKDYLNFCDDIGEKRPVAGTRMTIDLKEISKSISTGRPYFIDGQKRGILLKQLEFCRMEYNIEAGFERFAAPADTDKSAGGGDGEVS